jgi:hypothetical protein
METLTMLEEGPVTAIRERSERPDAPSASDRHATLPDASDAVIDRMLSRNPTEFIARSRQTTGE